MKEVVKECWGEGMETHELYCYLLSNLREKEIMVSMKK